MNILITGGAGFIGSSLALGLLEKGHNVTILDNLSKQIHGENPQNSFLYQRIQNRFNFLKGDVQNQDDCRKALKNQDVVVHLAAETGTGQSMYEIKKYCDCNVSGTAVLLDLITNDKLPIKKVIVASSRAIYGEGKYRCARHGDVYPVSRKDELMRAGKFECTCPHCDDQLTLRPTDENSKIHPTSIYGITKYTQEEMIHSVGRALHIPTVAFRYQNVYGPGQSLTNPYTGILSIFSTRIRNRKDIVIFEDGKESRDFVFIDDVVKATIMGIESENADYKSFNVGTGDSVSVIEIAEELIKNFGIEVLLHISGTYRLGDIRHNFADISAIKSQLGFIPQVSIQQGIEKFVAWVKSQEMVNDGYEKSLEEMKLKGLYK